MKSIRALTVYSIFSMFLFACSGDSLHGTYMGDEGSFLEKITFTSSDKVELVFMGSTVEGTYEIEDNKVKINNSGEIQILTITDDGCLDGGGFIGKYCKE